MQILDQFELQYKKNFACCDGSKVLIGNTNYFLLPVKLGHVPPFCGENQTAEEVTKCQEDQSRQQCGGLVRGHAHKREKTEHQETNGCGYSSSQRTNEDEQRRKPDDSQCLIAADLHSAERKEPNECWKSVYHTPP